MTETITKKSYRKLVALDFDGVLHSYTSPWTDAATIADPPTPGAMEFLRALVEDGRFEVAVVSLRCKEPAGIEAIENWLADHVAMLHDEETVEVLGTGAVPPPRVVVEGTPIEPRQVRRILQAISVVAHRPPATITLDDRALTFKGEWPSLDAIAAFQPWNKRPAPVPARDRLVLATMRLERLKAARREGVEVEDRELTAAKIEVLRLEAEVLEEALPERARRYAAAKGQTVDEILVDPAVVKVGRPAVDGVLCLTPEEMDENLAKLSGSVGDRLDREFARYADVERIVIEAVPPGTPVSRASVGGDLGWRVGFGWLSVEGAVTSKPDVLRDFARSLAAIPAMAWEKPRAGDPELVRRTLDAGRAM